MDIKPRFYLYAMLALCLAIYASNHLATAEASPLRNTPMVRAVAAARPSVVNIHGRKTVRSSDHASSGAPHREVNGMGTGVVIDERGYVVTNYHVIEGVSRIQVTLADRRTVTASLVAHDHTTDLAIIKLKINERMPVIKIGTSSDLMPAEPVVAVGNAYGYKHTVTRGIISELNRTVQVSDDQVYHDLIQTDASINPGNSGGPLLNIDGEMIGINVAVRVGAQGIGFAIPVDEAMEVAARLLSVKRKATISHGVVGKTKHENRVAKYVVESVKSVSPAAKTGLKTGDVITTVDGRTIHRTLDFERAMLTRKAGDKVVLNVSRGNEKLKFDLVVGEVGQISTATSGRAWDALGLRLSALPKDEFRQISKQYRGGLKIMEVRSGSAAAKQGIRSGDILIGLHNWETVSLDNIAYILDQPEVKKEIKFFILRGDQTFYGQMQASASSSR